MKVKHIIIGIGINVKSTENFPRELQNKAGAIAIPSLDRNFLIAEILKGDYPYGAPDFSSYSIAKELADGYNGLSAQFDEIWAMVYMMQCLDLIIVNDVALIT